MKRWILVVDEYEGIRKNAVNMLSGYISGLLSYVLPVRNVYSLTDTERNEYDIIAVGRCATHPILEDLEKSGLLELPNHAEGYSVYVGKTDGDRQMIAIAGVDDQGVLYGCMQFINEYCGDVLYRGADIWMTDCFKYPLEKALPEWKSSSYPEIKTRAIWTWGFVIYNYRAFFENMARLRLNEIVIWNDFIPFNAKDIVNYAHGFGIKVIWGFAWGWTTRCEQILEALSDESALQSIKNNVLETYKKQYADTYSDGIYFQSFTELSTDNVNGICVAETVTQLVNDIAGELLSENPELHIQFGLHASSVKTHLDVLKNVDKRIHIVWEDCGSFPYDYSPDRIYDFDQTYALTDELLSLRGEEERFGAVFKGMLKLDWTSFEHHDGGYILGERTRSFIDERQIQKDKIWKTIRGSWLKNAEYLRKTVLLVASKGKDSILQALVEDSMFENKITLPVAIYAETLWSPHSTIETILEKASKNPFTENI